MLDQYQSEILGIMFGDGSMSKVGGSIQVTVTGHKVEDKEYLIKHVCGLFSEVFLVKMKTRYRPYENTMDAYVYSKKIALTLGSWGMPLGLKNAGKLQPAVQLSEKEFVRGLFDTDGCIYRKSGKYKQIQFKGSSQTLMEYVSIALKKLGFHPSKIGKDDTKYRFYLCRQNEVNLFFRTIAPANKKHLKRFKDFQ
jgi:hypothetical protein